MHRRRLQAPPGTPPAPAWPQQTPRARGTRRSRRTGTVAALTLALLAAATATAVADPVRDPLPIGPDTAVTGLVNGAATGAVIEVGCFGPVLPGRTGHPLAGQYVEAETGPVSSATGGCTGSLAHSLVVTVAGSPGGSVLLVGTLSGFPCEAAGPDRAEPALPRQHVGALHPRADQPDRAPRRGAGHPGQRPLTGSPPEDRAVHSNSVPPLRVR